jgi:hypothetical protein
MAQDRHPGVSRTDKTALAPGGFLYMLAKMIHEAWTGDDGPTYFITVDGKWDVNFVE